MRCQFVFKNAEHAEDFINKLKGYFKTHDSISEGFMDDIVSHYYGAAIIDEYTVIGSPETMLKKPINIEFDSTPLGHYSVSISEKLDDNLSDTEIR